MKIEDDFLAQENFDELQTLMVSNVFPWFYNDVVDFIDEEDKFQFVHLFYDNYVPTSNIQLINPLLIKIDATALWRIKANLLTITPNIIENTFHQDMGLGYRDGVESAGPPEKQVLLKQVTTSIFYVNTNNGYTKFEDGTKVESVANRFVTFSTNNKHSGSTCTDQKRRVVINFNYFK